MLPEKDACKFIEVDQLDSTLNTVVDVRSPEAFDTCRIPNSVNHCVYLVSFQQDFPKAYPDRETPLIVYGEGEPYKADLAAFDRLQTLSYTNVSILKGGLNQWKAAGRPTEGIGLEPRLVPKGRFELDVEKTRVRWVGRNLFNQHDGTIKATSGFLKIDENDIPVAGEVMVDLTQMTCRDLEDPTLRGALIAHLQNSDFFDVANYPEASFKLKSARQIEGSSYGQPNYIIDGVLSARGKELELTIKALVEAVEDGFVFQSDFNFDRVALGAYYGSGKLFEWLGMHLVNDLVSIDVQAFFKF